MGSLQWFPQRLTAAITAGARVSFTDAAKIAEAKAPTNKAGVRLVPTGETSANLEPTGLGPIFEKGRRGGYDIEPIKAQALKIGSGFAAYATGGPMAAEPYVAPAAQAWADGVAQARLRSFLAGAGFA